MSEVATKPIVFIVGPTATGKTELALWLADTTLQSKKRSGVHIISADSRQVYRELKILSGADVPESFHRMSSPDFEHSFFKDRDSSTYLHGVSMISRSEEWSVAHFQNMSRTLLEYAWSKNELPIVVGGTGLQALSVLESDNQMQIPPDLELRKELTNISLETLQNRAKQASPARFNQLNQSDRKNPRRLIRLIEVARSGTTHSNFRNSDRIQVSDVTQIWIHLDAELDQIEQSISKRIQKRLDQGVLEEVQSIRREKSLTSQAISTLGFEPLSKFLEGELSLSEAKKLWHTSERQYAKRQKTWWKKNKQRLPGVRGLAVSKDDHNFTHIQDSAWQLVSDIL